MQNPPEAPKEDKTSKILIKILTILDFMLIFFFFLNLHDFMFKQMRRRLLVLLMIKARIEEITGVGLVVQVVLAVTLDPLQAVTVYLWECC